MSKKGKVGAIVFFLFSIGAVIFALKLIGNIEEGRKEVERLTTSLEEGRAELASVKEERAALEKELERARGLKEKIERELNQKITELQEEMKREREKKATLEKRFEEMVGEIAELEERYRKAHQVIADLGARLEELPLEEIVGLPPEDLFLLPPIRVEGEIVNVAWPFLGLELDGEVVAALKPALSVYRRNKLIRELDTKGIRGATLIARVTLEEDLEEIRKNDQVALSLSSNIAEMFTAPRMEGEVLDVICPGFLNINLGREGLENVEPILLVYRDGELFRKIELKDMDRLTIMVEAVLEANLRGIRERDIVKLTR